MIESVGPQVNIGNVCYIHPEKGEKITAEVVGFTGENVLLMPYTQISDIGPGSLVEATDQSLMIKVGKSLIGNVVDALGQPLDQSQLPLGLKSVPTEQEPPNPLERPRILEPIERSEEHTSELQSRGQ